MKRWAHVFAMVSLWISCSAFSADNIVINFDSANPPFMYEREGKAAGIYPALVTAAFKRMRVGVTLQPRPWVRALRELDEGLAGVGGIYRNAERERKYDFSQPIFVEKLLVYFNKSRPVNFNTVDDLKGLHIGVVRGWSYGERFDLARRAGQFTAEETPSDEQNFSKLERARLDAVLAVAEAGAAQMVTRSNIQAAPAPLALNVTFLTFAKSARKQALLKQFDLALKAMHADGEFERIVAAELAR
ncbi:MAG: ABC-type amino acid transport/signal transduction system, periplasmic component/domain [Proteobacteria bacterium]|nr:ABC-type amino acid transport/signal transduction system, periplasmic component/domain [Pseudomonadota bacterium]